MDVLKITLDRNQLKFPLEPLELTRCKFKRQ